MAWVVLFVAGVFEIGWAIGLKYTHGFSKFWPSVWTLGAMSVSIFLLSRALATIQVGTGYAVWTGIGAVGTVVVGMLFLDEPRDAGRIVCLTMIASGIVGLKMMSAR